MTKLQIGAQMYSVRDYCDTPERMLDCMKKLKAIGYNCCQLSGHNPEITATQLKDMMDEAGLFCPCTHISFTDMEENFDQVVKNHKILNCAYPGIGGLPGEFRNPEGYVEFAKRASKVAEKFLDHGMHFIYHNHAFEFYRYPEVGKTGLELLMENCSEAVQFELDMFWVQMGGGNPIEWIKKVNGRMEIAHFKEMNATVDSRNVIAPIGAGNMNWSDIMAACDEIGVKYAMIEQDNAVDTDSIGCMEFSYKTLSRLGGRF